MGSLRKPGVQITYEYSILPSANFIPDEIADKIIADINAKEDDDWLKRVFDTIIVPAKKKEPQSAEEWYYHFRNGNG